MCENCTYCKQRSSNEFVFPDGTGEPIGKWCSHPTGATQADREEVSVNDLF
jgi:hypothetical protein